MGDTLAQTEATVAASTASRGPPQIFVLLADGVPVGTASFLAEDLEERPDLTPWLANVFVAPEARGRGHVRDLIAAVEAAARAAAVPTLWLFTHDADRIYARAGWRPVEAFEHRGLSTVLMRRDLT
ncbi:MAG: GNAT family N-acetyltransferase [Alphaproteobacteria bacterium]|nr:GNAT family N-acetyltransferase [Alphaproteobacteria bacterium]